MPDESKSRFPAIEKAFEHRERLDCFGKFFAESVSDAQGLLLENQSANRCQDCPDTEICFKIWVVNSIHDIQKVQSKLMDKLDFLSGRQNY